MDTNDDPTTTSATARTRLRQRRPKSLLLVVLALALIAAACSPSDDDSNATAAAPTVDTPAVDEPDETHSHDSDSGEGEPVDLVSEELYNTLESIAPPGVAVEDYFALPETAIGPEIGEKGYLVEEINDGVYWITEGVYQMMFVVTNDGVVVVDAPPTIGDNIPFAIAEITDLPITHVIYSHSHSDHIGSAGLYPSDAEVVAHVETAKQLEARQDPNRPVPTVTFEDTYTLETGGKRLELSYPGNNHEPGNIFIHAPDEGVVMFVDVIFPGWMPWRNLGVAEDIPGFIVASDALLELDWDVLVSGHVSRLGTREDVEIQNEFIADLQAAAGNALGTVQVSDVIAGMNQDDLQPWAIFDGYVDAVVSQCVEEVTPKWGERLGGYDVFIWTQCSVMEQSLRID